MKYLPSQEKRFVKNPKKVKAALSDLQKNHNHSWYHEIMKRNKDNMNGIAIFYRDTEITYAEMKKVSLDVAKSLKKMGIIKGSEIIVCMPNIPEIIYLMLAANRIGAILNFVSAEFEPECLKANCFQGRQKILFISDNYFDVFFQNIDINLFEKCVVISLADSLPDGKDPYFEWDKDFCVFDNMVDEIKEANSVLSFKDFLHIGEKYEGKVDDKTVNLDTEFTITYTSGSTKIGWPKAIVHTNRSYISIGRFHDPDLSLMPAMRNMRGLAHIPTHSNTDIVSCISDTLMQTCTVACEPIYDQYFFARSLIINKPGFTAATRSFWIRAMKIFQHDKMLENSTLPFLINAVAVGEDISHNEEEYINQCFKRLQAGKDRLPFILRPATISVGGGNCEHGGLFFTLLKGTREKLYRNDYGLQPFQLAELAILREDGTECNYDETGVLVANSPCTMKEYRNNPDETKSFFIRDAYGRIWGNCNVWASLDKHGRLHMRGRIGNEIKLHHGKSLPMYQISDVILTEKEVMSCETVIKSNGKIVSYIELIPDSSINKKNLLNKLKEKIRNKYTEKITTIYSIQILSNEESFKLTKSGKRNVVYLEQL